MVPGGPPGVYHLEIDRTAKLQTKKLEIWSLSQTVTLTQRVDFLSAPYNILVQCCRNFKSKQALENLFLESSSVHGSMIHMGSDYYFTNYNFNHNIVLDCIQTISCQRGEI